MSNSKVYKLLFLLLTLLTDCRNSQFCNLYKKQGPGYTVMTANFDCCFQRSFFIRLLYVSDQPYRSAMYTLIGFVIVLLILLIVCVILLKRRAKERERDLFWRPHNGSKEEIIEEPNMEDSSTTPTPPHSWRYNITANKL